MLANKTKTELLAEAHSAGIKGSTTIALVRIIFRSTAY
jgi:hypothetical protein